ncbi:kinase-regulated stress-responsive transcription factor skn7 [Marasmius crinis-equi]|uniref:Kinase-regulated stress-responsive transcription factor skn7 n=1 Tax=Marasmius crinis-equi TaxID=585013 RepID=A0ABR3F7A9_9AGAR
MNAHWGSTAQTQPHSYHQPLQYDWQQAQRPPNIKREPQHQPILPLLPSSSSSASTSRQSQVQPVQQADMEDSMPSTSDFVKKLYKMLEDKSFQHVVSWGPAGDCFVVKDMNEFTKSILPRLFKHSNFASFVRQLNKYDFHKVPQSILILQEKQRTDERMQVKNTDDNTYGEHAWTFRHPDFHADRRDALENIKRKVPTSRKSTSNVNSNSSTTTRPMASSRSGSPGGGGGGGYYGGGGGFEGYQVNALQSQIDRLTASHEELSSHIRSLERNIGGLERNLGGLERNYHEVLIEMVGFQRSMAQQDSVMQGLIEWVLRGGGGQAPGQGGEGKGKLPALDSNPNSGRSLSQLEYSAGPSSSSSSSLPNLPTLPNVPNLATLSALQPQQQQAPLSSIFPSESLPYGGGMGMGVGRAALFKMNELSRRAELHSQAAGQDQQRPPSRLWAAAANAGLINPDGSVASGDPFGGASTGSSSSMGLGNGMGEPQPQPQAAPPTPNPVKITSRQEALERIEELQRMRPASANFLSNAAAKLVGGLDTFENLRRRKENGEEELVLPSSSAPQQQQQQQAAKPEWGGYNEETSPGASSSSSGSATSPPSTSAQALYQPFGGLAAPGGLGDHSGLEVYTVGHLMPKGVIDDLSGSWNFDSPMGGFDPSASVVGAQETRFDPSASTSSNAPSSPSGSGPKKLSVRRSTFVPGWTVSPRVLLVDDDAVSRKLSSKFLQVFGCKIDVAVDGVGAVNKMNLEKYDLVLMDIVMPKLDGVSATNMIRKFDHMTPIISMTSNAKPNEVMTYYSSGMNDILPKPFTKQGMLDMLEKHLMHLQLRGLTAAGVPRSVGIPPLSDASFEQAMTSLASSTAPSLLPTTSTGGYDGGPLTTPQEEMPNPLAGMGLSDEQYSAILQGLVSGESFSGSINQTMGSGMGGMGSMDTNGGFDMSGGQGQGQGQKRSREDELEGQRTGKRSRFEVIE